MTNSELKNLRKEKILTLEGVCTHYFGEYRGSKLEIIHVMRSITEPVTGEPDGIFKEQTTYFWDNHKSYKHPVHTQILDHFNVTIN